MTHLYLLGYQTRHIRFLLCNFVLPDLALVPFNALNFGRFTLLDRSLGEADSQDSDLFFLLDDSYAIGDLAAEFNEEFLSGLTWIVLDDVEVFEGQLLSFEGNGDVAFAEDLSLHRFDEVESRFVGFDLDQ